ncbi:MAG: glycosyltransferase, partial [Thermoanaerobaculia bacterium]
AAGTAASRSSGGPLPATDRKARRRHRIVDFSVIIAVKNDARVADVVAALRSDLPPNGEILVADDGTPGVLPPLPGASIVPIHGSNQCRARDTVARLARGSVLLFTDADVVLPRRWIRAALEAFEDPAVCAVQGNTRAKGGGWLARHLDEEYNRFVQSHAAIGYADLCDARCFAVRREVFLRFGFGSEEPYCEDSSLGRRLFEAGVPIRFVPDWYVEHYWHGSVSGELARFRLYASASERHRLRTGRDLFRPPDGAAPTGPGASLLRLGHRFPTLAPTTSAGLWGLALALGRLSAVTPGGGRRFFSRARRAAVLSGRLDPRVRSAPTQ